MDQHKLFQPIHKNGWSSDLVSFNDGPPPHAFEPSQLSFAHPRKFMPFLFKVAHYLFVFDIIKPLEANSLRSGPLFRCRKTSRILSNSALRRSTSSIDAPTACATNASILSVAV